MNTRRRPNKKSIANGDMKGVKENGEIKEM